MIVMGWVSSIRDHGNLHFVQVKDRFGETQVVAKRRRLPRFSIGTDTIFERTLFIGSKGTRKTSTKVANRSMKIIPVG